MRILDFSDGFESATEPLQGNVTANALKVFASDADFVTDKGSVATQGDVYSRSSDDVIRYHDGSAWVSLASTAAVDSAIAVHTGDTIDAHAGTAITNTPSGNLAATTVQAALNELQTDVDTRATSSALSSHESDTTSIHGITDTSLLLTTTGAQVVTAKDIDGGTASNTSRITIPKASKATLDALTRKEATVVYASDTDKLYYDDGSILKAVGSGSGNGINYITDSDAESGTGSWATYADAAASSPVDGTGGSPSSTWTTSTSSPLRGTASFLWTKSAANRQGEGFSYDFTIDSTDQAKVLQVAFDYKVASGTYADSDMTIWIYDVTNAALIQPAGYTIQNASVSMRQLATFQSASNSTSYRLIVHTASTSASAYTLQFDNFSVGPQIVTNGAAITDWTSFTPTGSWSTNTTYTGFWKREGDTAKVSVQVYLSGAPTSATLTVNLPSGLTMDVNKLLSNTTQHLNLGTVRILDSGTAYYRLGAVAYSSTTAVEIFAYATAGTDTSVSQAAPITFANGDRIWIELSVPIVGWSSNVQLSSDTDTRVIAAKMNSTTTDAIASTTQTKVTFSTTESDANGMADLTNNRFNILVPGDYRFTGNYFFNSIASTSNGSTRIYARVNGSTSYLMGANGWAGTVTSYRGQSGSTIIRTLKAGDYVELMAYQDVVATVSGLGQLTFFAAERLSGPSVIAASESVNARYITASANSCSSGVDTLIDFNTKVFDSHNAVTTGASWKFTAPVPGKYRVSVNNRFTSATYAAGNEMYGILKKNGSVEAYMAGPTCWAAIASYLAISGSCVVQLLAGDYFTYYLNNNRTAGSTDLNGNSGSNYICIEKIGNY